MKTEYSFVRGVAEDQKELTRDKPQENLIAGEDANLNLPTDAALRVSKAAWNQGVQ